jgi:uncharacterized membrane-anchored protein YitT (DUF2179 family)
MQMQDVKEQVHEMKEVTQQSMKRGTAVFKRQLPRFLLLTLGAIIVAFGFALFQVPHKLVAGGLSGIAIIVNSFTGWPVGLMFWVMNIPMLILGFFYLGRWRFVVRTLYAVTIFSIATDWFQVMLPSLISPYPLTDDLLLNAIYGGIVGGIGAGMLYRAGGTMGGTSVIGRIVQRKTGLPLSQTYFFADGAIIFAAGIFFGWEIALYGLLMLFINGMASDYTMEGPSTTRTATIITNHPEEISQAIIQQLQRGVSFWEITGAYTGARRFMLNTTVYRSQVADLKNAIADVDPNAFVTIGISHHALGQGFAPLRRGL